MTTSIDQYFHYCPNCNYQFITHKGEKVRDLAKRLHKKKCKKTGRTITVDGGMNDPRLQNAIHTLHGCGMKSQRHETDIGCGNRKETFISNTKELCKIKQEKGHITKQWFIEKTEKPNLT